jgi:polyvinyl alcohol dehydrogenase (cytochrome)
MQGISSLEELWATKADYPCCTFRGNMIKVDLTNGDIVWRTYMAPDNNNQVGGFSGSSLWGSSPAIDLRRNQVYISTGDSAALPFGVLLQGSLRVSKCLLMFHSSAGEGSCGV